MFGTSPATCRTKAIGLLWGTKDAFTCRRKAIGPPNFGVLKMHSDLQNSLSTHCCTLLIQFNEMYEWWKPTKCREFIVSLWNSQWNISWKMNLLYAFKKLGIPVYSYIQTSRFMRVIPLKSSHWFQIRGCDVESEPIRYRSKYSIWLLSQNSQHSILPTTLISLGSQILA